MNITIDLLGAVRVCAAIIGAFAPGAAALAGDGKGVVRTLELTGFERIEIAGVYDLKVEVGPDYAITLSGPAREIDRVEAEAKDGTLRLDRKEGKRRLWGSRRGVKAQITLPALAGLTASGVVDGAVKGVDAERFELDLSGVGDLTLEGECGVFEADVSGVGDLEAEKLECRDVVIEVSGVGDASVYASESVDAKVSGVGAIDVYGGPAEVKEDGGMFSEITVH